MNLFIPYLAIILASLTCSCQSISTKGVAASAANLSTIGKQGQGELKKGMTKEEVLCVLGKPSYQYTILNEETWVFENGNLVVNKAKETALNMVPVVGPAACLVMDLKPNAKEAKAEVVFNCDGKVCCFSQVDSSVCDSK